MVKQGAGIGAIAARIGDAEPLVDRAAPWLDPFEFSIRLVAHRELSTSRRIHLVFEWLAEAMTARW